MEKEIRSKENIEIKKGEEVIIKTTIDNLKTYNEKIIKENIYLTTPENTPYDFYIKTENGNIITAMGFNMGNRAEEFLIGDKVDIVGTLEINSFNGRDSIQFNLKDIMKSL